MRNRYNLRIVLGLENRHALRIATGDANIINRAANERSAIGHQHNLVGFLDRKRRDKRAITL